MKRAVIAIVFTAAVLISSGTGAQTRNDIMNFVIWPCIHSVGTEPYELSDEGSLMANSMVFILHRDYFEKVISMMEAVFSQQYPETKHPMIYGAGQVICTLYHPEPRRIGQ